MKFRAVAIAVIALVLLLGGAAPSAAFPQNSLNVNVNGAPCTGAYVTGTDQNPSLPAHITVWQWDPTSNTIISWLYSRDYPNGLSNGTGTVNLFTGWTTAVPGYVRYIIYHYNPPSVPDWDYTHNFQWFDVVLQCFNSPLG